MSDKSEGQARPLIAYATTDNPPPITPAPISRAWMSAIRDGWPNRCLPMLIANQGGWEVRNPSAFTATWMGGNNSADITVVPAKRDSVFLPSGHFGFGILTWHLPFLFRTPPGYNLLARGPVNYPKDAVCPLEGIVETDWTNASFSMSWKFTRPHMPVRFEVDEPICLIVPQRRAELEEFVPELRPMASDEELSQKYEFWLRQRGEYGRIQRATNASLGEKVPWQGDYTRGNHTDGEPGAPDHQTRLHLRPFLEADSDN
jgi:hypothetical protein